MGRPSGSASSDRLRHFGGGGEDFAADAGQVGKIDPRRRTGNGQSRNRSCELVEDRRGYATQPHGVDLVIDGEASLACCLDDPGKAAVSARGRRGSKQEINLAFRQSGDHRLAQCCPGDGGLRARARDALGRIAASHLIQQCHPVGVGQSKIDGLSAAIEKTPHDRRCHRRQPALAPEGCSYAETMTADVPGAALLVEIDEAPRLKRREQPMDGRRGHARLFSDINQPKPGVIVGEKFKQVDRTRDRLDCIAVGPLIGLEFPGIQTLGGCPGLDCHGCRLTLATITKARNAPKEAADGGQIAWTAGEGGRQLCVRVRSRKPIFVSLENALMSGVALLHGIELRRRGFALVLRLPGLVGHAVDRLAAFVLGQRNALFIGRILEPVGQAIAAEPGQIHQVDVLDVGPVTQMPNQTPEYGSFQFCSGFVVKRHGLIPNLLWSSSLKIGIVTHFAISPAEFSVMPAPNYHPGAPFPPSRIDPHAVDRLCRLREINNRLIYLD